MGKASILKNTINKALSVTLAALLLLSGPGGFAFAAPVARVNLGNVSIGAPTGLAGASLNAAPGLTVGSMKMTVSPGLSNSNLVVPQDGVIGSFPQAEAAAVKASPAVLPTAGAAPIEAAAKQLEAVDRHPVIGIVNEIQRAGGQKLLNRFTDARSANDFAEVASALPNGAAKRDLSALAARLSLPSAGGGVFDGSKKSERPQAEAAEASGFYAWLSRPRGWHPIASLRKWAASKAEAARPKAEKIDTDQFLLRAKDVRWTPNKEYLPEKASEAKLSHKGVVGQDSALEAIRFGLELWEHGYNLIVSGPSGTGRETAIRQLLPGIAAQRPTPNDLVAVTNIGNQDDPVLLEMAPGEGREFKAGVEAVLENTGGMLQKVFSTGQYAEMKKKLTAGLQAKVADRQKAIERKAAKIKIKGEWGLKISVQQMSETEFGIMAEVLFKGEPVKAEDIDEKLEGKPYTKEELMAELEQASKPLIEEFQKIMQVNMQEQAEVMGKLAQVEGQLAGQVISQLTAPVFQLAAGAPNHDDKAHEDWKERQQQYWGEFEAKMAEAKVGPFRIAFTQQGQIVMLHGEQTIVTPKVFEQLKADGAVDKDLTFETLVEQALAVAKPLLEEQEAIVAKINAEHDAIHANDPPLSESRKQTVAWLESFVEHLVSNYAAFVQPQQQPSSPEEAMAMMQEGGNPAESVKVSVLADNANRVGAPVVFERAPTFSNLFGEAESGKQLVMIPGMSAPIKRDAPGGPVLRSGSYLKARGGYLVLDLLETLREGTYPYLMRMVRTGQAQITEGGIQGLATGQGEQYKIDTKGDNMVKIVFIASPMMQRMLEQNDEDFGSMFRAVAEFEYAFNIAKDTLKSYLSFFRTQIVSTAGKLLDLDRGAIGRMLEEAAKMSGSNRKLTAQFGAMVALHKEAGYYAKRAGRDMITAEDVQAAVDGRVERSLGQVKRHIKERLLDGSQLLDIDGAVQGQNNGLAVVGGMFGARMRITYSASARAGGPLLVSRDRDANTTGSTFVKSVGVIEGFLENEFGKTQPIPAKVSVEFAQQYGGLDGDSATQTMLYGALSAFSGAKIKQGISMTGSMDQFGNVQPIGGENEKIEGDFDALVSMLEAQGRELDGTHGVILPKANVSGLMLRPDIAKAVAEGKYKIWAIDHVSQGVEILMDKPYSEVMRETRKYFAQIRAQSGR
jgi:predicted ATP-dependent protease